jgi:hypothetical protein
MTVWLALGALSQTASPLTLEEEWSNAMIYTDRHVLAAFGSAFGGLIGVGCGALALVVGADLLFPLGGEGLARSAIGAGLTLVGVGGVFGGLWLTLYSGGYAAVFLSQRSELAEIGVAQGWRRRTGLILPADSEANVLVKTRDTPYEWVELFRALTATSP